MVLMCDFQGMIPPEMQKTRHVVVMSPRHRRDYRTCVVVPFSTVAPDPIEPFHYKIPAGRYSFFRPDTDIWVKADMITHVSFAGLDRVRCQT
ncbi:type II toxin-antitoxin system PemK/MazF family toxin [Telmatobacter bradus]|uniref:type II toxin-antitoxin system PemK/MazF family toxin n=1 Tax=Telmatobacter bradus TaxID=474953 RepID=UPI003B43B3D5